MPTRFSPTHVITLNELDEVVEALAGECGRAASAEGARGPLASDEDAQEADYEALARALGRPPSDDEKALFRRAYSGALAAEADDAE